MTDKTWSRAALYSSMQCSSTLSSDCVVVKVPTNVRVHEGTVNAGVGELVVEVGVVVEISTGGKLPLAGER